MRSFVLSLLAGTTAAQLTVRRAGMSAPHRRAATQPGPSLPHRNPLTPHPPPTTLPPSPVLLGLSSRSAAASSKSTQQTAAVQRRPLTRSLERLVSRWNRLSRA